MCFSATASFAASAGLAAIGAASYRAAPAKRKFLAAIPLLFAVQQAMEGIQWLSAGAGKSNLGAAYVFLFFAFLVWPVFIPSSVFVLDEKRKKILRWFIVVGAGVSLALLALLATEPLTVRVWKHSIWYDVYAPFGASAILLYVAVVCGAMLVSSNRMIRFGGILAMISAGVSAFFFFETFTSVWCFFAAILSSLVYLFARSKKEQQKTAR